MEGDGKAWYIVQCTEFLVKQGANTVKPHLAVTLVKQSPMI